MAFAREYSDPSQTELEQQSEATREASKLRMSDPVFVTAMEKRIDYLDSEPPAPLLSRSEFLERYPTKK